MLEGVLVAFLTDHARAAKEVQEGMLQVGLAEVLHFDRGNQQEACPLGASDEILAGMVPFLGLVVFH